MRSILVAATIGSALDGGHQHNRSTLCSDARWIVALMALVALVALAYLAYNVAFTTDFHTILQRSASVALRFLTSS